MEVICLDDPAFYALIETVVKRLSEKNNIKEDKWISGEDVFSVQRIGYRLSRKVNEKAVQLRVGSII